MDEKSSYLRISARLGWTQDCKEPEQTRQALEAWLPEDRYLAAIIMLMKCERLLKVD